MALSDADMLTKVETAIQSLLDGESLESVTIGNETMRFPSLKNLYALRDDLKRRISAQSGSFHFGIFDPAL